MHEKEKAIEIAKKAIATVNKASDIVEECRELGFAIIADGIFLETGKSLLEQSTSWHDNDPGKAIDFSACPFWITTDCGALPIGITGADDPDLLNILLY